MANVKRRVVVPDRRKTVRRILLAALILIAVAGIGVLIFFGVRSMNVKLVSKSVPLLGSELCCGTGDGILYVKEGRLNYLSYTKEEDDFSKFLSASPTGLSGTSGVKAVYSDYSVQIIDASFDITPVGRVETVRCGLMHVAVCTVSLKGDETLTVYNATGQEVYSMELPAGQLINFGFRETSGTFWTMELYLQSGSPRTVITTYDLSRMSATGIITVSDQLVEDVFFTDSSVFVIGTESLIRFSASANREIYRVKLYGYRVIDRAMNQDKPMLLLVPRSVTDIREAESVRLLTVSQKDVAGETALTLPLKSGIVNISLVNGYILASYLNDVRLYSLKGEEQTMLALPSGVTNYAKKLDDKHILLERSGEFDLLTVGK